MRKLFGLILIATLLITTFMAVQPAAASAGGTTTNGLWVKSLDAKATYNRDWTWQIAKTGPKDDLTLSLGETALADYSVTVTGVSQDSNVVVNGTLAFRNMRDTDITITSAVVDITGGIQVVPTCATPPGYPPVVHPGYVVNCTFSTTLPDASPRTSTFTVTASDGTVASDSVAVAFGSPATETGACINVDDTLAGSLGQVCANGNPTVVTFHYSHAVGPYSTCGLYTVDNTATIRETGASSSHTVNVNVPCVGGCTLTQGYWKTHSQLGPAPYDPAWKNIGSAEEQTTFFLSGTSWYNVFWTAPKGNPYYILAHQYMAAKLNSLDGAAATPEVSAAIAYAETFFNTYTPTATLSKTVKNAALANANILDQFNNGLIGPGHCSE